ncbi:hypothetical protein [Spirillospora sp. NPDC047279]|uniref:hypothetical protein n=1 Tax=Spirillospora sp. NPDC047279 TaxID=3155478 RepID=UPI0033CACFE4
MGRIANIRVRGGRLLSLLVMVPVSAVLLPATTGALAATAQPPDGVCEATVSTTFSPAPALPGAGEADPTMVVPPVRNPDPLGDVGASTGSLPKTPGSTRDSLCQARDSSKSTTVIATSKGVTRQSECCSTGTP